MGFIKHCKECNAEMVVRRNRETGQEFFGCSQWPECKHTEPLPESIKMIRAGVPVLPGFE